jgi:hypothetical protein
VGLLQSTVQSLGAAGALICALSLAGPSTSHAAASNASGTDNGPPCNDLCKAYMAWSDQVMARSRPSRPQTRVVPDKRPDRTVHRASGTRQSGLNPFAQTPRRSDAAPRSVQTPHVTPHVQAAPSEPVQPITERRFPADGIVTPRPAEAGVATNAPPGTTLVSVTGLVSATQDTGTQNTSTTSHSARGLDGRFALSLGLALCSLLSLLCWGVLRRRMPTANTFR